MSIDLNAEALPRVSLVTLAKLPACMGGWCARRDKCRQYHAVHARRVVERLCEAGADGVVEGYPVLVHRQVGTWERRTDPALLSRPGLFDGLQTF
jgi:hypothetical protein